MKYIVITVLLIHGLIHVMGFAKAYGYGNITQLSQHISKPAGLLWLLAAGLFIAAIVMFFNNNDTWWLTGTFAAVISQLLIFTVWQDAKFGTIANVLALAVAFAGYSMQRFENNYKKDVSENLMRTNTLENAVLTEADMAHLPAPVQKYLRYAGVVNKPKVKNVKIEFEGKMREKGKGWFPFTSEQYNFFDTPARLFFMKGKMFGTTVPGYHAYKNNTASMDIRLFGKYHIVNIQGDTLFKTETVTFFNDMCLLAPAALIDKRIRWETIDSFSAKAIFANGDTQISATLHFNEQGQLVNFISDDRTEAGSMKKYRFSTPVKNYKDINGYHVVHYGEAVWHYPDGAFTYGQFTLKDVQYNVATE